MPATRTTLVPVAMLEGVTVPTVGLPAVPEGTVIVTDESVEVVAVVKLYM